MHRGLLAFAVFLACQARAFGLFTYRDLHGAQIRYLALLGKHRLSGQMIVEIRLEPFRQHQFGEHRLVDAVAKAARLGDRQSDEEGVEEALHLPRIALRAFGEDGADLLREQERGIELMLAIRFNGAYVCLAEP